MTSRVVAKVTLYHFEQLLSPAQAKNNKLAIRSRIFFFQKLAKDLSVFAHEWKMDGSL